MQTITIHSNQKLPLKIINPENNFNLSNLHRTFLAILTDPVVIAWVKSPSIVISAFTGKLAGLVPSSAGCVLAIWGNNGEPL